MKLTQVRHGCDRYLSCTSAGKPHLQSCYPYFSTNKGPDEIEEIESEDMIFLQTVASLCGYIQENKKKLVVLKKSKRKQIDKVKTKKEKGEIRYLRKTPPIPKASA